MIRGFDRRQAAVTLAAELAVVAIVGAWFAELVLGSIPCQLCLLQRWPYYLGVPVLIAAAWCFGSGRQPALGRALAVVALVIFVVSLGLGIYHAGAEWKFWAGPADCGGGRILPQASSMDTFRQSLETTRVVNCSVASGRVLGLSFAGWNAIVSALTALLALRGSRSA